MKNVKIALIDTGIDATRDEFKNSNINYVKVPGLSDDKPFDEESNGHGTAISFILSSARKVNIEIYSIDIFKKKEPNEVDYINALQFIYENIDVDIIHISSGVTTLNYYDEFYNICELLRKKNTTIIAAFSNQGVVSYPAAFDNVISVYWTVYSRNVSEYTFVENSPINIMAYGGIMKLPWADGTYRNVSGSSFSSAYITRMISENFHFENLNTENILDFLKCNASKIHTFDKIERNTNLINRNNISRIKKAIIIGVSKETHAVIGNYDLIGFDILDVYGFRFFGNVGIKTNELIFGHKCFETTIKKYEDLDWNSDFDTVILGHMSLTSEIAKKDMLKVILKQCIAYKKSIYSFDSVEDYSLDVSQLEKSGCFAVGQRIYDTEVIDNAFGSLNKLSNAVLGVFGTGSKQGKYNIQLDLRRRLINDSFSVGQLGTEPSALLFNMDLMYPMGYGSTTELSPNQEIIYINNEMASLFKRDILLIGSQSHIIPHSFGNIGFYTFSQDALLMATEPDAVILAINHNDSKNYIERVVTYLRSYFGIDVIGLVLYPLKKLYDWNISGEVNGELSLEDIEQTKKEFHDVFGLNTYLNGNEKDMQELYNLIINYFNGKGD